MSSRIDSSSPVHSNEPDAADHAAATAASPAPSSSKPVEAAPSKDSDTVESFQGRPATVSPSAVPPSGPAKTVQQMALEQLRDSNLGKKWNELRTELGGMFHSVSHAGVDVSATQSKLEGLNPVQYRAEIRGMEADGSLDKFVTRMKPAQRTAFIQQAASKGLISTAPSAGGVNGPASADPKSVTQELAPGAPPRPPHLYKLESRLPDSVNQALHEENKSIADTYSAAHADYRRRFENLIRDCRTTEELKKLGAAHSIASISEPGLDPSLGKWRSRELQADWAAARNKIYDTGVAVGAAVAKAEKKADFAGEQRAGSFWVSAEFQKEHEGRSVSVQGKLSSYGKVETITKEALKGNVHVGLGSISAEGFLEQTVDSNGHVKMETKAEVGVKLRPLRIAGIKTPIEISTDNKGDVTFGLKNSFVKVNAREGTMEVGEEVELGGRRLRVAIGAKGIGLDRAKEIATGGDDSEEG